MITGNKGEWSEIYALFKLLGDKKLHPGNSEIKKLENLENEYKTLLREHDAEISKLKAQSDSLNSFSIAPSFKF